MKRYILLLLAFLSFVSTSDAQFRVKHGGTGKRTHTANGVLLGNGTSPIAATTAASGDSGKFLMSRGASAAPTWATASGGGSARSFLFGSASSTNDAAPIYFSLTNPGQSNTGNQSQDPSNASNLIYESATVVPVAGTIKNLRFRSRSPFEGTITVTLMKNGSATTLTATITDEEEAAADTTHTVSVSAGDLLSIKIVVSSGANERSPSWALEYVPS